MSNHEATSKHNQEDSVTPTEDTTPAVSFKRPSTPHRWRRWLAGPTAIIAVLAAALVAVPAVQAGAATGLTQVTQGTTGTIPTVGNPVPAAGAQLAVAASTVDPINGDVAEVVGNQVFLLVNGTGQPATDFGIGTSGTLTQGDVYLVAGQGAPGWTPATSDGCKATATNKVKATATIIGKPQQATFDSSGNLLIASNVTGEMNIIAVPVTTGNYYGFTGMPAGYTCFIAGFTPSTAHLPAAPAINVHSASDSPLP